MHGSLSEAGPESSDRRVGTKEFGAESWDRGSVRSLPEVGPQSSDLRVGAREVGPESWGGRESAGGGAEVGARELGPEVAE